MSTGTIAIKPVVNYPRRAEVGRTYMLTVDLQPTVDAADWPYPDEEYTIYCELDAAPLFGHRAVGEPALVLHRFGGTYGPASFLLTTGPVEGSGVIVVNLLTAQGLPLATLTLDDIQVVLRGAARPLGALAQDLPPPPPPPEADPLPERNLAETPTAAPSRPLTPLSEISAIDAETRDNLAAYWIGSAEELATTARADNSQYGSGRAALAVALGLAEEQVATLVAAAGAAAPDSAAGDPGPRDLSAAMPQPAHGIPWPRPGSGPSEAGAEPEYAQTAMPAGPIGQQSSAYAQQAASPGQLFANEPPADASPGAVEPPGDLPPPLSQGKRNTNVAFALTAAYQALSGDATPLSAQFLYWVCKDRDNIKGDVGTNPQVALKAMQEIGVCTEATWPYRYEPVDNENPGHERPPDDAFAEAEQRRISGYRQLPSKDIAQIKAALAAGQPVLLGLPIWEHWTGAWQARSLGKLRKELPGERRGGGQAMCALGYRDDAAAPGGGYFILRNSWGADWAAANPDGPGYCWAPYALVAEQGLTAFAVEGVAAAPPAAEQPPQPASADWPLTLIAAGGPGAGEELYPNGVDGLSGQPLLRIDAANAGRLAARTPDLPELQRVHQTIVRNISSAHFDTLAELSPSRLDQARWAVVVSASEDAGLLSAIWPLVERRMEQMGFDARRFDFRPGESCAEWHSRHTDGLKKSAKDSWGEIPPVLIQRPGEGVNRWLARHGVAPGPVDPRRGVPYYLLLLGRPGPIAEGDDAYIPISFQHELERFWAVGRLCFSGPDGRHKVEDYGAYAERLAAFERQSDASRVRREVWCLGTGHAPGAGATSGADLLQPTVRWLEEHGRQAGYLTRPLLGDDATRANLRNILAEEGRPPALLVVAAHGLGLPADDGRQLAQQGALVLQDWPGQGGIRREHWFAGEDLADVSLDGMVALLAASYSAGSPQRDELVFREEGERPLIAPFPFVAQLPQQMLRNGALAVIGQADRGYALPPLEGLAPQHLFEDLLGRLIDGRPVGDAFEPLKVTQSQRAMRLSEELEELKFGKASDPAVPAALWAARNDARAYTLLGDPAARLAGDEAA